MVGKDAHSDPDLTRRKEEIASTAVNQVRASVPVAKTGLVTLEILEQKPFPDASLAPGAKPARSRPAPRQEVTIMSGNDVIVARHSAQEMARELGFEILDQTRIAAAACELSRNVYQYAGKGKVTIQSVARGSIRGIEIVIEDQGPGIPDLQQALQNGAAGGSGQGQGLPGSRQLMDDFNLESQAQVGTKVTMRKWLQEEE